MEKKQHLTTRDKSIEGQEDRPNVGMKKYKKSSRVTGRERIGGGTEFVFNK